MTTFKHYLMRFAAFFILILFPAVGRGQSSVDSTHAPVMDFIGGKSFDFGRIPTGPETRHSFEFRNSGRSPLILRLAQTSGGGGMATWSKEPVMPGKKGSITYIYLPQTPGRFWKTITVFSNAGPEVSLQVTGTVVPRTENADSATQTAPLRQ